MKKTILILIALCLSATFVFAQNKPAAPAPPAPKEQFKPDLSKQVPLTFTFKVQATQLNDYLLFENAGEYNVNHAGDISALRATEIKDNHKMIMDSVKANLNMIWANHINGELKKFNADTLAKHHPVAVKKEGKK